MAAPRKDDTKEIIMNATCKLLESKALAEISLADIAKEANISKGTLYYHYKTKSEIFFNITDRYLEGQWEDFIKWTENKEKDTSLRRLIKYVIERNVASATIRMHLLAEAQLGNEEIRQALIKRYDAFQKLICEKIAQRTNISADFLTWLVLLVSDGIIVQEAIGNTSFDREKIIDEGLQLLEDYDKK